MADGALVQRGAERKFGVAQSAAHPSAGWRPYSTRAGRRVVKTFGVVRGVSVRSRSIFGTMGAGLQTLVGGNITILTNLCERTREHALVLCLEHARQLGANACIGLRYDATEVMQGVTEVLCYGTAVLVEPTNQA